METKLIAMLLCIVLAITSCSSAKVVEEEPLEEIVPLVVRDEGVPVYGIGDPSFEGLEDELEAAVGTADGMPSDTKRTEEHVEEPPVEDLSLDDAPPIQGEAIDEGILALHSEKALAEQPYGTYFEPDEEDAAVAEDRKKAAQALSEPSLGTLDDHTVQGMSDAEHTYTDTDTDTENPDVVEGTDDIVDEPDFSSDGTDAKEGNPFPSAEKDAEGTFFEKATAFAKDLPLHVLASIGAVIAAVTIVCIAASKRRRRSDGKDHEDDDDIIQAFLTGDVSIVGPEPEGRAEPASPPGEESKEG